MALNKTLDVICIGRAAVDLYGLQIGGRLEDMQSFAKYLGGSSGNLAAGLARLGSRSSMLTRVGNEHMGRFVREALESEGVDVSHVATDPKRMTALVILGIIDRESFPHIFFRENCADMGIETSDFDEAYIASARALAITGTHISTDLTHKSVLQAVRFARNNQTQVVLDIDYRPVLWGLAAAGEGEERFIASATVTERLQSLIADCDMVIGTEEEIHIAGGDTDTLQALKNIRASSGAVLVLKRGALGCTVFEGAIPDDIDDGISARGVEIEILNTVGAGDAFLSGFLNGWLNGESWQACAQRGNACGALVVSRHGCTPAMPTRLELEDYLSRSDSVPRPDRDDRINLLHRTSTRRPTPEHLYVLAFDHRSQLEALVDPRFPVADQISRFKALICEAVLKVDAAQPSGTHLGIIVDDRYGGLVLPRMQKNNWWVGSPVETPGSRPLEFDPQNNFGLVLQSWPKSRVVKCLVFFHPDDPIDLRLQQEQRVMELHADCVALDRELLLEVITTSQGQTCDDDTMANAMRRFYNLGIFPAWWKLQSQSEASWANISAVIEAYDPLCHGVLMLGLNAPENELKESFNCAAGYSICKGFAVGRSIFGATAAQWFSGKMDDAEVVTEIANRYQRMIDFWKNAQLNAANKKNRSATA